MLINSNQSDADPNWLRLHKALFSRRRITDSRELYASRKLSRYMMSFQMLNNQLVVASSDRFD